MSRYRLAIIVGFHLLIFGVLAGSIQAQKIRPAFLVDYNQRWVDSVFQTLTLDEKIGQLLLPRGNFSGKPHDVAQLKEWVTKYKIGGVVFFASSPVAQVNVTNTLQSLARVPLLIGQDFEWGVGMRLDSTDRFPYAVAQGAVEGSLHLNEQMGREVARQCRRLGVHINYAPVVDVNNNPSNPVINFRSYGSDREIVAQKGLAYMKGMQEGGILCTAKHFPGHGDTDVDSHHDLPLISHEEKRLHEIELYPFKKLIEGGLSGIMTAHLEVPALENRAGLASTFSENIITGLLRRDLGFEGLTFTDAMDMKGAVKNMAKGEAMVRALLAGNDVLETFMDVPGAVEAIRDAVGKGVIPIALIDQKVMKILKAKSWVGLDTYRPVDVVHLAEDLNSIESDVIIQQMTEKSVTCLRNEKNVLPYRDLTKRFAVISLEGAGETEFYKMVRRYVPADYFTIPKNASDTLIREVTEKVAVYDHVIVAVHLVDIRTSKQYGLNPSNRAAMERLSAMDNATICLLGNPFILGRVPALGASKQLVLAYQQNKYTESIVPQVLFGAIPAEGRLPVFISDTFPMAAGVTFPPLGRLSYGLPEQVGLDRQVLHRRLDSIMHTGIKEKAFPGGVVQVAVKGKVIFTKAYGFHTYDEAESAGMVRDSSGGKTYTWIDDAMDNPLTIRTTLAPPAPPLLPSGLTKEDDVFDLASITKVSTSLLAVMQLVSDGRMSLDAPLQTYYPTFRDNNKGPLTMRRLLTHTAGLQAWIPFWKDAVDMQATAEKAFLADPTLEKECVIRLKKPGFFKRLFGATTRKMVDMEATLQKNPDIWQKLVTPATRTWKKNTFYPVKTKKYPVKVADGIYLHRDYYKTIIRQIADSPLKVEQGYVYSDLHYYLYPAMIPSITGMPFTDYLSQTYQSLGATSLQFNPREKTPLEKIVPTEYDSLFRQTQIHGYVHDEGAAMLGGISGHAGLFGNANDLTKLMQLYLNEGYYGGKQYIRKEVVQECTAYQYPDRNIRRGIGFDKKDFDPAVVNAPVLTSPAGFGHSGFTGTFTWADPAYDLVYVVLTNRVYPTRNNSKISTLLIRPAIGDAIIQSIKD